ncbi:hypothetical protein Pcinc_012482 [Petrolisthes cinctipes]|uniref:Uncharacterized protein n=1 Tax=Petrolisthes cinctipes TaxID=88211 RepID=A0AAE1G0W0_PETCI|nr:hypothetical protein Pcinc_012482 [Petrolisthes cinctipes]
MEERVRVRLRRRIVPDRSNPFEDLAEEQFLLLFRLSKECVLNLLQNITEQLPIAADARGLPLHAQIYTERPHHLTRAANCECKGASEIGSV